MRGTILSVISIINIGILATGISFAQSEILVDGSMESNANWNITYLNTTAGSEPIGTWNYTLDNPTAGVGGCLLVSSASESNQRQYCIYQELTLSDARLYTFNGALKDISADLNDSWCEVFLGTEPVVGEDYGSNQILLAKYSTWDACTHDSIDGTFINSACHEGSFIPDTSGTYYFVFKIGTLAGNAFDILVDELSLVESSSKPYPAFSADILAGFAPIEIQFTSNSKMADSWAWDFGDESTSTQENPSHTYSSVGKYTVTLTVSNAEGDSVLTKTEYITVNEDTDLPDGEMIYGGNMESADFWNITNLNAPTVPTATWNYTNDSPSFGQGGNLHLTATVTSSESQYCIWQAVELKADSAYVFDGAFKDITGINDFWCEVFIGTVAPTDGNDYGADSIKIAQFNTWSSCDETFVDGTFQLNACSADGSILPYRPNETGTYFFAIKIGNNEWGGGENSYEILLDEITFKERTPVILPIADFFADIAHGDAPLTVQFYNQSENASEYLWSFGDGETSTSEEPSHTYTENGQYTVRLIAFEQDVSDTLEIENLIAVGPVGIDAANEKKVHIYPNPTSGRLNIEIMYSRSYTLNIYSLTGEMVYAKPNLLHSKVLDIGMLPRGIYFLETNFGDMVHMQEIILE